MRLVYRERLHESSKYITQNKYLSLFYSFPVEIMPLITIGLLKEVADAQNNREHKPSYQRAYEPLLLFH